MLPPAPLMAYPLLLVAIYAIFRLGRRSGHKDERFEYARLTALALLLGLVMALQVRFIAAGYIRSPLAMMGAVLSIAGVFGLVGINLLDLLDSRRRRQVASDATPTA